MEAMKLAGTDESSAKMVRHQRRPRIIAPPEPHKPTRMTPAALQGLEVAQRLNNKVQAFGIYNPGEFEEIPHQWYSVCCHSLHE